MILKMLFIVIVQSIIFFATNDPSIGKVKEEIINDEQILPYDTQDRIIAYLVSIEGSTTSDDGGDGGGNKQFKYFHHHQDDTATNSADYEKYSAKQRAGIGATSFSSSDLESTTFLDETEDDRLVQIFLNMQ